jgi:hypothetical protein
MAETEIKKSKLPTMTLGWESGIFILESIKANERKTNGRKMVAQEKAEIRKSLSLTKTRPCLEKEMRTKKARAKKKT